MARKTISDEPRLIDLHKVGLPWAVASLQKREIARMERLLRDAEAAGHDAETASRVRQSIKAAIGSEQFRHFIETTEAQDGYQWPVATIAAATLRKMGLPDDARVLRLPSETATALFGIRPAMVGGGWCSLATVTTALSWKRPFPQREA